MEQHAPQVAVIMRTKNSAWVVGDTLAGLFSQVWTNFELLVVDSGSTDNTLDIVRKYPCRIIEIEPTAYVPGIVLNMAVAQTKGDIVVFLNSDTVPQHPEALGNLLAAFADPRVQAAYARQIPRPEAHAWVCRDYAISFPATGTAPSWITLSLPMAAVRRGILESRPFYTDSWASEDTEWGKWAKSQGFTIQYVPEAVAMHSHNYTLRQIYGRRFVEGEADAFIYGHSDAALRLPLTWAISVLRDWLWCLKLGKFSEIFAAPARRAVYHWAHWKGYKLGQTRIKNGDTDLSKGQHVVLTRQQ